MWRSKDKRDLHVSGSAHVTRYDLKSKALNLATTLPFFSLEDTVHGRLFIMLEVPVIHML